MTSEFRNYYSYVVAFAFVVSLKYEIALLQTQCTTVHPKPSRHGYNSFHRRLAALTMQKTTGLALTIFLSIAVAAILTMMPLPEWAVLYRPAWLPLAIIYWTMAVPQVIGVGMAWFIGLYMDAAQGTLLGQNALGYAITAYLSIRLHRRVRVHPMSQQALAVGLMLLPSMSITLWVKGIQGQAPNTWLYWAPVATSMVMWPVIYLLLRGLRRRSQRNF